MDTLFVCKIDGSEVAVTSIEGRAMLVGAFFHPICKRCQVSLSKGDVITEFPDGLLSIAVEPNTDDICGYCGHNHTRTNTERDGWQCYNCYGV